RVSIRARLRRRATRPAGVAGPSQARDERRTRIGGPLVERTVVDGNRTLAQQREREGARGGRDAARAVGDDARRTERRGEPLAQLLGSEHRVALPVDEESGWHRGGAGDVPRARPGRELARELLGRGGAHERG